MERCVILCEQRKNRSKLTPITTRGRRLHDTAELFILKAFEALFRTNSGSLGANRETLSQAYSYDLRAPVGLDFELALQSDIGSRLQASLEGATVAGKSAILARH
jgi:hypothetical protein